ncbi:putative SP-containing protein [Vairimorpha necatrix]|uniref:SP-containing protein n=1 Tax=Vairimorpha necatrix TaxID=6039 RepID=A0AAX4JFL3_9MICR
MVINQYIRSSIDIVLDDNCIWNVLKVFDEVKYQNLLNVAKHYKRYTLIAESNTEFKIVPLKKLTDYKSWRYSIQPSIAAKSTNFTHSDTTDHSDQSSLNSDNN